MNVFIVGSFGNENLGDDLLYICIMNYLGKTKVERKYIFTNSIEITSLNSKFNIPNVELINQNNDSIFKSIISKINSLKGVLKSKVVILGPGGLFPKGYNITYMIIAILGVILRKKVLILGVELPTILKFKFLWNMILKKSKYIVTRDIESNLVASKFNNNSINTKDIVFSYEFKHVEKEKYTIKYNINNDYVVWELATPYLFKDIVGSKQEEYKKFIDDLWHVKEKLEKNFGENIIHVFIPFYKNSDEIIIKDFVNYYNIKEYRIIDFSEEYNFDEIVSIIQNAKFSVAMRYHSVILSLMSRVPLISISYAPKSHNLLKELNLEILSVKYGINKDMYYFNEFDIDRDALEKALNFALNYEEILNKNLNDNLNEIKNDVQKTYNNIVNHLII